MQIGNKIFDTEHHTAVMAILNVTPDSFSDGGLSAGFPIFWKQTTYNSDNIIIGRK